MTMKTVKTDGKYRGVIVVEKPLDREEKAFYKLIVSTSRLLRHKLTLIVSTVNMH